MHVSNGNSARASRASLRFGRNVRSLGMCYRWWFTVTAIIEVENLTKRYGDVQALRGVSFAVQEGEVFGLLGPNGAGKTSTVEILEGLRAADGGRVSVCGLDPQRSGDAFKQKIGAVLQSTALPDKIRVEEALNVFASFYTHHRDTGGLLKRFALEEK